MIASVCLSHSAFRDFLPVELAPTTPQAMQRMAATSGGSVKSPAGQEEPTVSQLFAACLAVWTRRTRVTAAGNDRGTDGTSSRIGWFLRTSTKRFEFPKSYYRHSRKTPAAAADPSSLKRGCWGVNQHRAGLGVNRHGVKNALHCDLPATAAGLFFVISCFDFVSAARCPARLPGYRPPATPAFLARAPA